MDYLKLKHFSEIAIFSSPKYRHLVKDIYDEVSIIFPDKNIYLVSTSDIICSAKCDKYDSYILVGIECRFHSFDKAVQYKIETPNEYLSLINNFHGPIFIDSIYDYNGNDNINYRNLSNNQLQDSEMTDSKEDDKILVITENQDILDFYSFKYENVICPNDNLLKKSRVSYLMKENISGLKIKNKKMVGVVFTSRLFESIGDAMCNKINQFSRAYKIFLKDLCYERLISIDNLDCIVLVDCPFFHCNHSLHIPILTPFAVESGTMDGGWTDSYSRNYFSEIKSRDIIISTTAQEIMESRLDRAINYRNKEENMDIQEGRSGIASKYEDEI